MRRAILRVCVVVGLMSLIGVDLLAQDVLLPSGNTPQQVVSVRKFAMAANAANLGDLRAKVTAGAIKAVAANARAIAVVGLVTPALFAETYSSVYPVQGSRFFFKGGSAADLVAAARGLAAAAQELAAAADKEDKAGVEALVPKLQGACGACHGAFRGQY